MVESLFAWQGLGHALVHAVFWRDVPVLQAARLVLALLVVAVNNRPGRPRPPSCSARPAAAPFREEMPHAPPPCSSSAAHGAGLPRGAIVGLAGGCSPSRHPPRQPASCLNAPRTWLPLHRPAQDADRDLEGRRRQPRATTTTAAACLARLRRIRHAPLARRSPRVCGGDPHSSSAPPPASSRPRGVGGWLDAAPARGVSEAFVAVPALLVVLLVAALAPRRQPAAPSYPGLALAQWVEYFRVVRARAGLVVGSPAVEASGLLGPRPRARAAPPPVAGPPPPARHPRRPSAWRPRSSPCRPSGSSRSGSNRRAPSSA